MTTAFKSQFTSIKGLSDRRRLPRLGKLRLGFKAMKGTSSYPVELPFFLLPQEVAATFGFRTAEDALSRAKALGVTRQMTLDFIRQNYSVLAEEVEVMFPINDRDVVFPQAYKWYGNQKGVKCIGNGETARRHKIDIDDLVKVLQPEERDMVIVECPCNRLKSDANPKGDCTQRGHLLVMVPKVNMGGVYQIDVGSFNSIVDLNSGIDYAAALTGGRFCLVPLTLRRKPTETHHAGQKQTHYTLQVLCNVTAETLNLLREGSQRVITQQSAFVLPPPEDINPQADDDGPVMEIAGELVEEEKAEGTQAEPTPFDVASDLIATADSMKALKEIWESVSRQMEDGKIDSNQYRLLCKHKDSRKIALKP